MVKYLIVIFALLLPFRALTQRKTGEWQDYLSYGSATKITVGDNKLFAVTDGGLFYVDLQDNSMKKLGNSDGLTDVGITNIAYHNQMDMLLVVYKNSNIDLVFKNEVVNLADIFRKQMTGDKTIHNIKFHNDEAFLACGFGIVAVNLAKREIKGTYIIGESGSQLAVFDVETDGQHLYAATSNGIYTARLDEPNLLDFNNWHKETSIPHESSKFSHLTYFNGEIIASYTRDQWDGDELYALRNGIWQRDFSEIYFVNEMEVYENHLVATGRDQVFIYNMERQLIGRIRNYNFGQQPISRIYCLSTAITSNGSIWIADNTYGLIRIVDQKFEQYMPLGPLSNSIFSLSAYGNSIWVSAGGRTDPWNNQFRPPVFQEFTNNTWNYFSQKEFPELTGFFDLVQVAINPKDPGHIFAASWGGGLLEFKNGQFVKRYYNKNSPLQTALPEQPDEPYTRIGGIAFDNNGVLWVTNAQSSHGLHSLNPNGEWHSYQLDEVAGFLFTIGQPIVTKSNDIWIVIPRGRDVYVVNNDVSRKRHLPVTSYFNNGKQEITERMNDVYSIAEDLSGDIWIGTSKGVAVFANPERVWREGTYYAFQPSLEMGDNIYHPLLVTETITSIAIDGANRKWLGTKSSGLYLVSERGDKEILHFNTDNSPLLSNHITSLAIQPKTGELFIGTELGLMSYQGDAPAGEETYDSVYVYPNPVRETYEGPVVIKGLIKNSDVRITDIAGNLVHKTKSLGSQVMWDGKNLNGRRVSTGVYMIFIADASGEQTHIAKLLFIR